MVFEEEAIYQVLTSLIMRIPLLLSYLTYCKLNKCYARGPKIYKLI